MNNFWKFIVFAGLFFQLNLAHCANHSAILTFTKENSSKLTKEYINSYSFIQPSVERGTPDYKHNNRIPLGLNFYSLYFQSLLILDDNTYKIVLTDQDIDRNYKVSILLFPFHYHW